MITATNTAIEHIKNILKKHPENALFHLSVKETGCSGYMYVPDIVLTKKENDIEIALNDLIILIDKNALPLIEGTEMDYVKKNLGSAQLSFQNPNAEGLCGCGESFTLKKDVKN